MQDQGSFSGSVGAATRLCVRPIGRVRTPIQHILRAPRGTALIFHNGVWHSPMPSNLDYDPYNMHDIYCPPWLRRGDREATDPAFLARASARRRALTPALASGASVGDFDKPDTAFSGGNYPPVPFEDEWER